MIETWKTFQSHLYPINKKKQHVDGVNTTEKQLTEVTVVTIDQFRVEIGVEIEEQLCRDAIVDEQTPQGMPIDFFSF